VRISLLFPCSFPDPGHRRDRRHSRKALVSNDKIRN
jgi:hypothetical protein